MLELAPEAFGDPFSVALVALGIACLIGLRSRWARPIALGGVGVVGLALVAACFDGEPRVTAKFDATTLAWASVVTRRAVSGLVVVALAMPLSRVATRWAGLTPWWLPGATMGLAPGIGLVASSLLLLGVLRRLATDALLPEPERLGILARAVHLSHAILVASTALLVVGCSVLVRRSYRLPSS